MSAVTRCRDRMRERVEKEHGVRLTFMPFLRKGGMHGARGVSGSQCSGGWRYDHLQALRQHGIAVASDAGLVVPNIKDAHAKGLIQIGREISEVAKRARDGKLNMDDLTGGTFTITNGGVFGSLVSTPIINYPQVGILGLHKRRTVRLPLTGASRSAR